MNSKTPALELVPLELKDHSEPAPIVAAPTVAALSVAAPSVTTPNAAAKVVAVVDKYFAAAEAEFQKGDIDQPLWDRALNEAKGDREKAIVNYLRTRATSLKVSKREPRTITYAPVPRELDDPPAPRALPKKVSEPREAAKPARKFNARAVGIAATCAGVVVCAALLYVFLGSGLSPKSDVVSAATPMNRAKPKAPATADQPVAPKTAPDPTLELIGKIETLRVAGNWNVLVLYAGEWARREPWNAAAWNELSLGYERLRQFDDAYNAATKAVALAPEVPLYWRNLGQLDLELNLHEEALRAYEGATALDDRDMHSLVRSGILYWRLARLPEAKVASDKALALSPEDPDALCLKAVIAKGQAAQKVLNLAAKQPRDATCREMTEVKDAPMVANSSPPAAMAVVPRKR